MAKVVKNSEKKIKGGAKKGERRGGRQKGTPNKRTADFFDALGDFSPLERMVEIANSTEDESLVVRICETLLKYMYPQRKAVEVQGDIRELPVININGVKI